MTAARELGYLLAKRGHTCVNGAGSFGCMAAMNDGAVKGGGQVVGVIHEMWLVDGDSAGEQQQQLVRDGGAHAAFSFAKDSQSTDSNKLNSNITLLVAGGTDLQERKRLLVDGADALVVLPGGPGTWDELWEMACARGIGLTTLPIVCVNVKGYYEPFKQMLMRAYQDGLTKLEPHQIVHFVPTAKEAVRWIEDIQGFHDPHMELKKRASTVRQSSFVSGVPVVGMSDDWFFAKVSKQVARSIKWTNDSLVYLPNSSFFEAVRSSDVVEAWSQGKVRDTHRFSTQVVTFSAGIAVGLVVASAVSKLRSSR
jgi:uncharacterized protein (TIGR00730 family)